MSTKQEREYRRLGLRAVGVAVKGSLGKAKVTTVDRDGKVWKQCAAIWATRASLRFCTKTDGHEGDHRATGVQWTQDGRKVPITEKCP